MVAGQDLSLIHISKTNALRALDKLKISYRPIEYDVSDGRLDGVSVAEKAGMDPAMVYKTLVVWGKTKAFYVFIVPVDVYKRQLVNQRQRKPLLVRRMVPISKKKSMKLQK